MAAIDFANVPLQTWLETGFVVFFGTYLGYILMMIGQSTLRPTVVGVYNYVQPAVSVTVSILTGMGIMTMQKAVAIMLVCLGVWLVIKSKSKADMERMKNEEPVQSPMDDQPDLFDRAVCHHRYRGPRISDLRQHRYLL